MGSDSVDNVEVRHVSEVRDGWMGFHTPDHPFYYHPEERRAYIGPHGKYHGDVDWKSAGMGHGYSTTGRIDAQGHVYWYDPEDIRSEDRQTVGDCMARAMGQEKSVDITPDYDDGDWHESKVSARVEHPDMPCARCGRTGGVGLYPEEGVAQCRQCGQVWPIGSDMGFEQRLDVDDFRSMDAMPTEHRELGPPRFGSSPRYLYNKFQPQNIHPPGPDGPEMPFIYDPASRVVHLGPPNSYHYEMIQRTPELQSEYPKKVTRAPFQERLDHLHGRLIPSTKETVFYREHELDPAQITEATSALGATHRPTPVYQEGDWETGREAKWSSEGVTNVIHVPGMEYGKHSLDTPYIYDSNTGALYHGDFGAFHSDVEKHPALQPDVPGEWNKSYGEGWMRGRYTDTQATHYHVPGFGSEESHALLRPHMQVEKALGVKGDPYFDYGDGPYSSWADQYFEDHPVMNDLRKSNILDPVHDTLDPRVWTDEGAQAPKLKPHLSTWIKKTIYEQAAHFHPEPEKWLRLVFTGSLTTYQYSDQSDVDVSLFVSPHFLPEWSRGQLIGLMVKNVDGTLLPGTPFPLQAFVVAKNISTADLYQPGLRSGYDIEQDHWLVPPDRLRAHDIEREYNVDYVYALESADKMERLLRYDPERAVDFWHQIHKRRMRDQSAGKGDFSQANIVYKMLANRGLFPDLSEASGEYIA